MTTLRLPVRGVVWLLHMAAPVLGLWLLVARPQLDGLWEHHLAHFWLVLVTAAVSLLLALVLNHESVRREDARLFLISLAFAASAGFLGLHALATPAVLLERNTGFVIATPIGLLLGAGLCLWSTVEFTPDGGARLFALRQVLRAVLALVLLGWLLATLSRVRPLDRPLTPNEAHGPLVVLMAVGAVLYVLASIRFWRLYRRRPSVMLISVITAFVLLAESMVSVAYARNWHASWWEWHVLMTIAFCFVGYSALVQWGREGSATALFSGIALTETLRSIKAEYGAALEALVEQMDSGADEAAVQAGAARLADRFDLSERQRDILVRAAQALAHERDQIRRQGALVEVGQEASVIRSEEQFLERVQAVTHGRFGRDSVRILLLRDGRLDGAASDGAIQALQSLTQVERATDERSLLAVPLTVKGKPAGVVEVSRDRPLADRDRALFASFASQVSIALENARLYQQLDGLFRSYLSPDVATSLLADPGQAALGGATGEVTVLMADLKGFTPFSEAHRPAEVVSMLNTYYGAVVPVVIEEGGTLVQFVGDALMALFNAPVRQEDHALRAARAALRAQQIAAAINAEHDDWPCFRMGINTGPALIGNIGAPQMRNFTAIGDTTNLAARLESAADVGQVVISATTRAHLGAAASVEPMGMLDVKGKAAPVEAFVLTRLTMVGGKLT